MTAYFRRAFGLGFDLYSCFGYWTLDIYLGPLTIEIDFGNDA